MGDLLLRERFPGLKVDVHTPDWVLTVEIREQAYLYGPRSARGRTGCPAGSSGRGLLLLSGGIDSPVAGWMMAKRGLALDAVYFHSAPFTSEKARREGGEPSRGCSRPGAGHRRCHVVPFTPVLARIQERSPEEEITLLMRACMMRVRQPDAARRGADAAWSPGRASARWPARPWRAWRFTGS